MPFAESVKKSVRKRCHGQCCLCKSVGIEIHHIVPQEESGPDTSDNAAPLCPSCHEIYGANPTKRKFIRESRDHWYEICDARYKSDDGRLDELKGLLKNSVSYEQFREFKEEITDLLLQDKYHPPRGEDEIANAIDKLFDQIWYNRHHNLKHRIEVEGEAVDPEIWKGAQLAARMVEKKYPKGELGPWDDFEWGMINGKMSALRWVLGDEWDFLDT